MKLVLNRDYVSIQPQTYQDEAYLIDTLGFNPLDKAMEITVRVNVVTDATFKLLAVNIQKVGS